MSICQTIQHLGFYLWCIHSDLFLLLSVYPMKIVYFNIPYHHLLTKKWYIRFTIVAVHFAFPRPPWLVFTASDFLVPLWNTSIILSIFSRHIGHFLVVWYICPPHGRHVVRWPHGMNTAKPHGSFKHTEQNPMDSSPSHLPSSAFETTSFSMIGVSSFFNGGLVFRRFGLLQIAQPPLDHPHFGRCVLDMPNH